MTATELQAPDAQATSDAGPAPVSSNGKVAIPERNPALTTEARRLVREQVADTGQADPLNAVEVVLRDLVTTRRYDVLVAVAREGLLDMAWEAIRHDATRKPSERGGHGTGKWGPAADTANERRDIFEAVVFTGTEKKYLGDCTKADLIAGAEVKSKQANTMLDNAERMTKLARKLKAGQVVADLDREVVEGVFNA